MIVFLSLAVALIGLVVFVVSKTNAEAKEIGRIMLWTGLLAFLLQADRVVRLLH